MKKNLIPALFSILLVSFLFAQDLDKNFPKINPETVNVDYLNQQWYIGKKQEILLIVNSRLAINKNDLGCLLLIFEYSSSFMEKEMLLDAKDDFIALYKESPIYNDRMLSFYFSFFDFAKFMTDEMVERERYKGNINKKRISSIDDLRILEKEGYVAPLAQYEKDYIEGKITKEEFFAQSKMAPIQPTEKQKALIEKNAPRNDNIPWPYISLAAIGVILVTGGMFWWRKKSLIK